MCFTCVDHNAEPREAITEAEQDGRWRHLPDIIMDAIHVYVNVAGEGGSYVAFDTFLDMVRKRREQLERQETSVEEQLVQKMKRVQLYATTPIKPLHMSRWQRVKAWCRRNL